MADFTRLTIIGTARKADLVIPDDEAIGVMLPRLMELLGEHTGSVARPLTLIRPTGEQLDVAMTPAEQQLLDGELLRFVRADEAPPPPEVADVTDVLGESLSERPHLWSSWSRALTGGIALAGLTAAAVYRLAPTQTVGVVGLIAVVIGATIAGRVGRRWGCAALTSIGLGAVAPLSIRLATQSGVTGQSGAPPTQVILGLAATLVLAGGWFVLGAGFGLGLTHIPARSGALFGFGLAVLPLLLMSVFSVKLAGAVALTTVAAVICCGLLPRYAMAVSGLTGLDDQVVEGELRRRDEVKVTMEDAYQSLTWSTYAVTVPLAAGMAWLIADPNRWAGAIGVVVALIISLRTRAFPLTAQQMALWIAVLIGVVTGLLGQHLYSSAVTAAMLFAVAGLVVILVVLRPAPHQRAFWRRTGNLIESLAVISLVPLLLGLGGIYGDLLQAFRR